MKEKIKHIKINFFFVYICVLILIVAIMSFLNLKLIPIDGLLQTYNSTRRINLGEVPYRDFTPYLGLGPVYVNFLGAKLFGSTLVAQFMFINVFHLFIGIFILYALFEIFFCREIIKKFLPPLVIALTCIYLFGLHFPFKSFFFILAEYTRPGNSALGLRAVIIFLTIYVCLKIERGRFVFLGYLLIGLSLAWSVDYAFVTYIIGSLIFRFPSEFKFARFLKNTITNLIIGAGIGFLLIFIFTQNNLDLWYSANYLTQRDFQFWYFGVDENFVYEISSIPYLIAFIASTSMATIYLLLDFNKSNFTKFLTITATTSIGMVSQLNSAPSPRYLVFALLANLFGFLGLWSSMKQEGLHFKYLKFKVLIEIDSHIKTKFFKKLLIRDLFVRNQRILVAASLVLIVGVNLVIAKNYVGKNIYVSQLGGYVDPKLIDSVQSGEELAKLKGARILSTYSGVTSLIAGKMNATKTDYIIHAFTQSERDNWINALKDPSTHTVITTREDVLRWEPWIAKANWWFYSELMNRFQISRIGAYEVYWSRKTLDFGNAVNLSSFNCSINVVNKSKAYISITPVDTNLPSTVQDLIFSIELAYESFLLDLKLLSRNRVTITPMNELFDLDARNPKSFLNVGAPQISSSYKTYLKYTNLSSNQLLINSSPNLVTELEIKECRIKAVHNFASLFPKLPETNMNFDGIVRDFKR
jgi:hypothetical protein